MKNLYFLSIGIFLLISTSVIAKTNYPFRDFDQNNDILAYWYNVPEDSVNLKMMGNKFKFHSSLQIYGKSPSDSFTVRAVAYLKSEEKVFDRTFKVDRKDSDKSYSIEFNNGFFKLVYPVEYHKQNPEKIILTIKSLGKERTKEIKCHYHKLSGKITDFEGNPLKGFVVINPDAFSFSIAIWSDSLGNYEIDLPERTYNNIAVDDESYGIKTAEGWGWHIIMDSAQNLDFKIGTGEVYNLNVWANNGGGNTYFISFRPMSLHLFKNMNKTSTISIDDRTYNLVDVDPNLKTQDISVKINGKETKIILLQKYYETMNENAMMAYLLQVSRDGHDRIGKQTILVEYENEMEVDGRKVLNNSIGYFQFHLNYSGLSKYF
jgi:HSP20 family molecular chaperone IbpA